MEPGSGSECLSSAQKNYSRQHVLQKACITERKQSAHTYKCIVEEEPEAAFGYGTAKSAWPLFRKTDRST
jgi:hypothetical protein